MTAELTLPNFFLAGAPKCGTTWLAELLGRHDEIYMPASKEPGFLSKNSPHGYRHNQWSFYAKNYVGARPNQKICDASTLYFYSTDSPAMIRNYFSSAKILIMLRNPVDRLYSNYWQYVKSGYKLPPFSSLRQNNDPIYQHMLCVSQYPYHLKRFLNYFDRDQLMILIYEDFQKNLRRELSAVFSFIGVADRSADLDLETGIKNPAGRPRSKAIARLLRQRTSIQLVKRFIPTSFIRPARQVLISMRWANTDIAMYPEMSAEERAICWEQLEDIPEAVEQAVGVDTMPWRSDRSRAAYMSR